jgi:hypothetical protein
MLGFFKRLLGIGYRPITKVATDFNEEVIQRYVDTGTIFGDAVSYIYMGQCVGFAARLQAWEDAEVAYAALGYRTLSLDDFVDHGGYGKELVGLKVARDVGEDVILHARFYRDHFLDKVEPLFDLQKMQETGEMQCGNYEMPSTKHLVDEK